MTNLKRIYLLPEAEIVAIMFASGLLGLGAFRKKKDKSQNLPNLLGAMTANA